MALTRLRNCRNGNEVSLVEIMREMGWEPKEARRAIRCVLAAIRIWMLAMSDGIDIRVGARLRLRGLGALTWRTSKKTGWTRWIWTSSSKIRQEENTASAKSKQLMREAREEVYSKHPELYGQQAYTRKTFREYQKKVYRQIREGAYDSKNECTRT